MGILLNKMVLATASDQEPRPLQIAPPFLAPLPSQLDPPRIPGTATRTSPITGYLSVSNRTVLCGDQVPAAMLFVFRVANCAAKVFYIHTSQNRCIRENHHRPVQSTCMRSRSTHQLSETLWKIWAARTFHPNPVTV